MEAAAKPSRPEGSGESRNAEGGVSLGQKLRNPPPDLSGVRAVIRQPSGDVQKAVPCMNAQLGAKVWAASPALPLSVI